MCFSSRNDIWILDLLSGGHRYTLTADLFLISKEQEAILSRLEVDRATESHSCWPIVSHRCSYIINRTPEGFAGTQYCHIDSILSILEVKNWGKPAMNQLPVGHYSIHFRVWIPQKLDNLLQRSGEVLAGRLIFQAKWFAFISRSFNFKFADGGVCTLPFDGSWSCLLHYLLVQGPTIQFRTKSLGIRFE